jgi:hypothetical protein
VAEQIEIPRIGVALINVLLSTFSGSGPTILEPGNPSLVIGGQSVNHADSLENALMRDSQNHKENNCAQKKAEPMQFMNKPHEKEDSQSTDSNLCVSEIPVPSALDRPIPAILFQALRVDCLRGIDFEISFAARTGYREPASPTRFL